jgi:hypothetical protein
VVQVVVDISVVMAEMETHLQQVLLKAILVEQEQVEQVILV